MCKTSKRILFRHAPGVLRELVAAGSSAVVCDPNKPGSPALLRLDLAGVDELMAALMEAADHLEPAPVGQGALPLMPREQRSPAEVLRDMRRAGW